eukprot:6189025-Pleurochrysis_carterae.AAC.2
MVPPTKREDSICAVKFNVHPISIGQGPGAGPGLCLFGKQLRGRNFTFTRTHSFQGTTHPAIRAYYDNFVVPQLLSVEPQANERAMRLNFQAKMTRRDDFVHCGGIFLLGNVGSPKPAIQVIEHNESLHFKPVYRGFTSVLVMLYTAATCM